MNVSPKDYTEMSKQASPNSKSYINIPMAFLIGGLICVIGELIMNAFLSRNFDPIAAGAWTSIILVLSSALFTGFGWYSKIAKHGGAGTLVPITGFANAVVSPALEFKSEGFVLGVGAKIFSIAGPVILYGCAASVIYGFIYYYFIR